MRDYIRRWGFAKLIRGYIPNEESYKCDKDEITQGIKAGYFFLDLFTTPVYAEESAIGKSSD